VVDRVSPGAGSEVTWRKALSDPDMQRALVFVPVVLLVVYGLVMVYSSSMIFGLKRYSSPTYFLDRQIVFACLGLAVMIVASRLPVEMYRRFTLPLLAVSLVGLVACLTPLGTTVKGASRWISLGGGFNVQPSEIAKLAIVFYVAYSMSRKADRLKSFKVGFLPHVVVAFVFAGLCMKQPDFGAAMMIVLLAFVMLFVGGTRLGYILGAAIAMVPVAWAAIAASPYRMKRVLAFLNPDEDALGVNYQITESLISIGSGGPWGLGLGNGKQKLFFLPDAHTDFIASIVGEELGMLGVAFLLLAFGVVVTAGISIALRTRTRYGAYLAAGLSFYIALQVVVNMGVVMGLLPTKGLALPFMSYGGSSLLTNMFAAGVLMSLATDRADAGQDVQEARPSGNVRLQPVEGGEGEAPEET